MAKYGLNRATLVGNLGKDPEIRYLDQGIAVVNFSLATTERFRKADGSSEDRTEWHNIVMWRGLAETAAKYLKKGSTILVEGRIVNRSWDGPDGQKRYRTEVEADNMVMLDGRPQTGGETQFQSSAPPLAKEPVPPPPPAGGNDLDDLPF